MNKRRMRGFLDPISLGFVLAIAGTVTALSLHSAADQKSEIQVGMNSQQVTQTQVVKKD